MSNKIWHGTITNCQLCDNLIDQTFIDGQVRGHGWAIMCPLCHEVYGVGLGTGLGQKYKRDTIDNNVFYKEQ